jgi:alpha-tubulin suppressor-like RCC1 family protein
MPEPVAGLTGISTGAIGGSPSLEFACELDNGTPLCEGSNSSGQLGNDTMTDSDTPVAVQGITGATSIGAGAAFACALIDGTVECWGSNAEGQLGNGTVQSSSTPVSVSGIGATDAAATQIAVGSDFACALLQGGSVECWGDNASGVLGDNFEGGTSSSTPVAVTGFGDAVPSQLAAGENHVCALTGQGVYCWGDNTYDQLGMGGASVDGGSSTPVESFPLTTVTAVAAGGNETGIIMKTGGQVACWGSNAEGQLGTSSGSMSSSPMPVGVTNATAIAVGGEHACALVSGGSVECWGYNVDGEIGTGSLSPTVVTPPQLVVGAGSGLPANGDAGGTLAP